MLFFIELRKNKIKSVRPVSDLGVETLAIKKGMIYEVEDYSPDDKFAVINIFNNHTEVEIETFSDKQTATEWFYNLCEDKISNFFEYSHQDMKDALEEGESNGDGSIKLLEI